MSNWYCNFKATGDSPERDRLREALDDLWCRVEIKESSHVIVSASTIEGGLFADGWDAVEAMVEQFPALRFTGTLCTTQHREYLWSFEGRDGATTWQTLR